MYHGKLVCLPGATTLSKDTQHSDIQHNDTQHKDPQHSDIQHNDTQHKVLVCDTHHERHSA